MKPNDLSRHISKWFEGTGPCSDVVISSRIRLARNLESYEFLTVLNEKRQREVMNILKSALIDLNIGEEIYFLDVDEASALDRDLLVERHLISTRHAKGKGPRGVIFAASELFTAMINEEDHLRMQVFRTGLQLDECYEQIRGYDDMLEKKVHFAFSERYGYLTACPTNVGTGMRVSVMLHLPGLKMTNQIDKLVHSARDTHLTVRGLFGEGTEAIGDFFQLSNQVTLGRSEQEILDNFGKVVVPKIREYELLARQELLQSRKELLEDKIQRALGVLRSARMISSQEALFLLSNLRMGVNLKRIENIPISTVNELFMLTQPAHLQVNSGSMLGPDDRDIKRAQIIREKLSLN